METSTADDVAAMCQQLLDGQQVPIAENLLDLGLNSVLVIRLRKQIALRYGVKLPLTVFFENPPSAASIAAEVNTMLKSGASVPGS